MVMGVPPGIIHFLLAFSMKETTIFGAQQFMETKKLPLAWEAFIERN